MRQCGPPSGIAAQFEDHTFCLGRIVRPDGEILCLFNRDDTPRQAELPAGTWTDFWTDAPVTGPLDLPAHSARVLRSPT